MKRQTTAWYPIGKQKITKKRKVMKPLMKIEGLDIKEIDFSETTAHKNFADVKFFDKEGKWLVNTNKSEEQILKKRAMK